MPKTYDTQHPHTPSPTQTTPIPLSCGGRAHDDPWELKQRADLIAMTTRDLKEPPIAFRQPPGYRGYGNHCGSQVVEEVELPLKAANGRWVDQLSARMNTDDQHSRNMQLKPPKARRTVTNGHCSTHSCMPCAVCPTTG